MKKTLTNTRVAWALFTEPWHWSCSFHAVAPSALDQLFELQNVPLKKNPRRRCLMMKLMHPRVFSLGFCNTKILWIICQICHVRYVLEEKRAVQFMSFFATLSCIRFLLFYKYIVHQCTINSYQLLTQQKAADNLPAPFPSPSYFLGGAFLQ